MSRTADQVGSLLADRYRIVAPLGTGGSARVYLADDTQLHRRVAVKVLHEALADDLAFLKRFRAEARAAAALSHPNVMHVYDSGSDDGLPFLVLEFLGGGSLRAVLDQDELLTPSQALLVGLGAARGLEYAHRRGFVHRDIKPANLLFDEEGRLRIADFGLARAIAEAAWTEPEGMLLGTAKYAAPEQAMGGSTDGRGDVYSLALVLIEAVTGSVPFARETAAATLMARCDGDVVVPAGMGQLARVLERAGRRDPELRPDAGELEIALLAAAEEMDPPRPIPLPGAIAHAVLDARLGGSDDPTLIGIGDDVTQIVPLTDPATRPQEITSALEPTDAPRRSRARGRGRFGPRRRSRMVAACIVLALFVGGGVGAYWWWVVRTPSHALPDMNGVSLDQARRRLTTLGYRVSTKLVRRDGTEPDEVVAQKPSARTELAEGTVVELTVSLGNQLVTVPALDPTMDEATVLAKLAEVDLVVGAVTRPNDEVVAAGFLISATPATAATAATDAVGQIPKGSAMDLVISAGPAPRTIPVGLTGQTIEAARLALENQQLVVNVATVFDDEVAAGVVLSLVPGENTELARGSTVDVSVSKGPEPIPIPDVTGKSGAEATTILQAAGFPVSGVEGSPANPVLATDPPAGEPHQKGTSVRVFARR